ncbi:O-antigen ligase family protein [Agromyces archimandritae]|uniref:O-antigen ligase family protein n=1 Tax=Agromyces archimandritae TaxID=2781962 RepID=A0A975FNR9_9MICO|nr:O-antigen ligase family protein [Agromyces archimandritae]QTX05264.1 O-antigen ligase family protein [Agromyces archimandritae]
MIPGRSRALVRALATFAFFTALGGQFWRNLLGWWGWGAIAVLTLVAAIVAIAVLKPGWHWRRVPKSAIAFVLIAALSIAWSAYPAASALGLAALAAPTLVAGFIGLCLAWDEVVRTLSAALKWLLALSLAFELWVSVFVRHPLLPNFTDYSDLDKIPMAFYWSRDLLFAGGPIEGIVASRNLLGMYALVALIVFSVQLASGLVRRGRGIAWVVVAAGVLVLTRSATVLLVGLGVLIALVFVAWARRVGPEGRRPVYVTAVVVLAALVAALAAGWNLLLAFFGKSEDLTGRLDIWAGVWGLIGERPWFGWGWVGYWPPWVEMFGSLAERKGVVYLQAHNAWLDVWMQLGILGLIAFFSLVLGTLWRSWFLAVDRPVDGRGAALPSSAISMLPLLVTVALVAQSLAESRILIEGGWLLLLVFALVTKRRQWNPEPLPR